MFELPDSGTKSKLVTVRAETDDAAFCNITEVTLVAKLLSRKRVAQVNFNKRNINGEKSIPNRNAGVRECTRINDYENDTVRIRLLHAIYNFMFCIALEALQLMPAVIGQIGQRGFDVRKAGLPINARFTSTQHIEVRAVDQKEAGHAFFLLFCRRWRQYYLF